MKLRMKAPDVNLSEYKFTVDDSGSVVYGLGAIKGVGEGPVETIVATRQQGGPFTDLFDFCARVDLKRINKRVMEALIRSGALDSMGPFFATEQEAYLRQVDRNRAALAAAMEEAIAAAEQTLRSADSGHDDLFGDLLGSADERDVFEAYRNVREWSFKERLRGEKDTLGLYLTGHPIDEYEQEVRRFARQRIIDLKPSRDSQTIAGLVFDMRVMKSKRGDKVGFVTLDDRSARVEVSLFAEAFQAAQHLLQKDALLVVEGEVAVDDFSGGMRVRAKKVMSLEEARTSLLESVRISLDTRQHAPACLTQVASVLQQYKGECAVTIDLQRPDAQAVLRLGEEWRVEPADELVQALRDQLGKGSVSLHYR